MSRSNIGDFESQSEYSDQDDEHSSVHRFSYSRARGDHVRNPQGDTFYSESNCFSKGIGPDISDQLGGYRAIPPNRGDRDNNQVRRSFDHSESHQYNPTKCSLLGSGTSVRQGGNVDESDTIAKGQIYDYHGSDFPQVNAYPNPDPTYVPLYSRPLPDNREVSFMPRTSRSYPTPKFHSQSISGFPHINQLNQWLESRGRPSMISPGYDRYSDARWNRTTGYDDRQTHLRSVVIRTTRPIHEPFDLEAYFKKLYRHPQVIDYILMDTFEGLVYVTFKDEQAAQNACEKSHDPASSNILELWIPEKGELDFLNDCLSVHGDPVSHREFQQDIFQVISQKRGYGILDTLQTDCVKSMMIQVNQSLSISDLSSLLVDVSMDLNVMVAPVKKCFKIFLQWNQTEMSESTVLDYIKWNYKGVQIKSVDSVPSGLVVGVDNEIAFCQIVSREVHDIWGRSLCVHRYHPCLSLKTYLKNDQNHRTHPTSTTERLKGNNQHGQHEACGETQDSRLHYTSKGQHITGDFLEHKEDNASEYSHLKGSQNVSFRGAGDNTKTNILSLDRIAEDLSRRGAPFKPGSFRAVFRNKSFDSSNPTPYDENLSAGNSGNTPRTAPNQNPTAPEEKLEIVIQVNELELLLKTKFIEELQKEHDDLTLDYDRGSGKIVISGSPKSLKLAKYQLEDHIKEHLANYDLRRLTSGEVQIFTMAGLPEQINEDFGRNNIAAYMSCANGAPTILYAKSVKSSQIEATLQRFITFEEHKIDPKKIIVYQSKQWASFLDKLKSDDPGLKFSIIELDQSKPSISLVGSSHLQFVMKARLEEFEKLNPYRNSRVSFDNNLQEYSETFFISEMQNIREKSKDLGATIEPADGEFLIEGLEDGLQYAEKQLEVLRDKIKVKCKTLDYPGAAEFLQRSGEDDLLRKIGIKHSCLIKLSEDGAADESTDDDEEEQLTNIAWDDIKNCKITVVKGDPELLKVDRILNFIKKAHFKNSEMPTEFVGGQETWNKIKKDMIGYNLETLETSGKKNKDVRIQHFICKNEEKTLREALKLGFNKASSSNCQALAIALGGIDNLEHKQESCSKLITHVVTKQIKEKPTNKIKSVFICGNEEKLLRKIALDLQLKSPGDTTAVNPPARKPQDKSPRKQQKKPPSQTNPSSRSSMSIDRRSKLVFTPITVQLISGDILTETTDVMVTSIQNDLNMKLGQVIRSVLQKGGAAIQQELNENYPNGIAAGEFAASGGGKLQFKRIFHACLPTLKAGKDEIKELVHKILEQASEESLTSVAIPALGTANLSYDPAMVCKSIVSAVEDFAKENQQTSLKLVKLVVFTGNGDILKRYGKAMLEYDSPAPSTPLTYSSAMSSNSIPTSANDSFGNISFQLKSGDLTDQKTTAIVVSVDRNLDLKKGKVAQAIFVNGGASIQLELNKKYPTGLEFFEYGRTDSGNLPCEQIYFVCLPPWKYFEAKKMKKLILDILKDIESSHGTSVSLPAFGTGNLGYPPEEVQKYTMTTLQNFDSLKPQYLRTVEIVVHPLDTHIQKVFLQGLHAPVKWASGPASLQMISPEKKQIRGFFKTLISALTNAIGLSESKPTETTFKVDTVTLTVREGDITEEVCDAFVAAINNNMDLESAGAVCNQISKKCEFDFIKRCLDKASDMKEFGYTSVDVRGGSLKCKEVFFISMDRYSNNWNLGIEKILQAADKKGLRTLALPTFGAAHPDTDLTTLIQQIKEAIINFGSENPRSLTDIRLIVYDRDILKEVNKQSQETFYSRSVTLRGEIKELSQMAHVVYYFTEENNVKRAMDELMKLCTIRHVENTYQRASIKQFTDAHFKRLQQYGNENMFKVTYNKDDGIISMAGFGDLAKIHIMITDIEKEIEKQRMENLNSGTLVHWQYQKDDIVYEFDDVLNMQLEADYRGKKLQSMIDMGGETYTVDFEKKTITHKDTGSIMDLIRKDDLEAGEPIPKNWEDMSLGEQFKLVSLAPDSDEYKKVVANYRYRHAKGNVHGIERVQNRSLYQQFIAKKREIDLRNPGHQNEMSLFHGSDFNAVNDINKTGFNRSYCGKNATVYGHGVYFAESSAYSEQYATPDANGMRKLYQARVLVGVSVETDSDTKYLPKQPGTDVPYDSGRAPDSRKEGIHIIFHDSQAYPEYIITFSLPINHIAP